MQKFSKFIVSGVCCALAAGLFLSLSAQKAEARPNYFKKAFLEMYPKHEEAKKTKCNTCHFGKKKKNLNDYGMAVKDLLGATKVKDDEKVKDALKKAEDKKSSVEGKTFGDLLKDGKLPGKAPEGEE